MVAGCAVLPRGAVMETGARGVAAAAADEGKGCFFLLDLVFLRPVPVLLLSPALLLSTPDIVPAPLLPPSTAPLLALELKATNEEVDVLRRFSPVSLAPDPLPSSVAGIDDEDEDEDDDTAAAAQLLSFPPLPLPTTPELLELELAAAAVSVAAADGASFNSMYSWGSPALRKTRLVFRNALINTL